MVKWHLWATSETCEAQCTLKNIKGSLEPESKQPQIYTHEIFGSTNVWNVFEPKINFICHLSTQMKFWELATGLCPSLVGMHDYDTWLSFTSHSLEKSLNRSEESYNKHTEKGYAKTLVLTANIASWSFLGEKWCQRPWCDQTTKRSCSLRIQYWSTWNYDPIPIRDKSDATQWDISKLNRHRIPWVF